MNDKIQKAFTIKAVSEIVKTPVNSDAKIIYEYDELLIADC